MAVAEFLGYASNGEPIGYDAAGVTNRFDPCPGCEYAHHHPTVAVDAATCDCRPREHRRVWPLILVAACSAMSLIFGFVS